MLDNWIFLVALYGVLKGIRDVLKKKALQRNTVMEVLFFYTVIGFLFVIPGGGGAFSLSPYIMAAIIFKSFFVFSAWLLSFKAIEKLPISFFGVMDLSGVLFSTVFGIVFLREAVTVNGIIGLAIVMSGLLLVNYKKDDDNTQIIPKYVIFALLSCILNAISGIMDKVLMSGGEVDSSQLQFWFMLDMVVMYAVYILVTKTKINIKSALKNYYILIISVLFVVGDRALFIANGIGGSTVSVMVLLKQSACFVSILGGFLLFKEKNVLFRAICATLILVGIFISVLD